MATWKRVVTSNDAAAYKNDNITLAQLDAGLDSESNYGANKILKVNGAGNAIIWAEDSGGIALSDLSVTSAGSASGAGGLDYNNSTGVFTHTRPAVGDGYFSENSFTNADHTKLDGIATGADVTPTWVPSSDPSYLTSYTVTAADVKTAMASGFGSDAVSIGDSSDTVTIPGNLTVSGTTTTINTSNLEVSDRTIKLNSGFAGTGTNDIGIIVERGTEADQALFWDETGNRWAAGSNLVNNESFSAKTAIATVVHKTGDDAPDTNDDSYGLGSLWLHNTAAGTNGNQSELFIRVA